MLPTPMGKCKRLMDRAFYARDTLLVAREMLGQNLVYHARTGIITETEAYHGTDDPASHAARGMTKRNAIMFGPAGYAYVYLIYGMYFCMNITTATEGVPGAVLLRGVWADDGMHLNGPGKLCRGFGISMADHGRDVATDPQFHVTTGERTGLDFIATPRIGIKQGLDRMWRFVLTKAELENMPKT